MNKNEEKIYGIYPGSIERTDLIDNLNEIDLYLQIDAVKENIYWKYNMANIAHIDVNSNEDRYALEYLMWYEYYENHFKNVLNESEWNEFLRRKQNDEDVSEFLPSGKWKEFSLKRKR